jgi:hypothetical protein
MNGPNMTGPNMTGPNMTGPNGASRPTSGAEART